MNPNEVCDFIIEGMKYVTISGGITITTYLGIFTSNKIVDRLSKKITTQSELDKIIETESQTLKLKNITGKLCNYNEASADIDINNNKIIQVGGDYATKNTIKHELYHHYKKDCIPSNNIWLSEEQLYWFIQEPRACLYGLINIKL